MAILDKYSALTREQQEKFLTLKDAAAFDIFLAETGVELTAEEKEQITNGFETGKIALSDAELENAAGGACVNDEELIKYSRRAEQDGRLFAVRLSSLSAYVCERCKVNKGIFENGPTSVYAKRMEGNRYHDCKCYHCGKLDEKL